MSGNELFARSRLDRHHYGGADMAVRTIGAGPPMLFVHGFPTHSFTWRDLLPLLSPHFTCVLVDLPGLGSSQWDGRADLSFSVQTARLAQLIDDLDLRALTVAAHDTGATLARLLALARPSRVTRLALLNTEIPGHRPPWIEFYQAFSRLPGAVAVMRALFTQRLFVRSSMGLGAFYSNKALLDRPEVLDAYVQPLVASRSATAGALAYLRGVDWALLDTLEERHRDIAAETLFLWGEDDPTFPVDQAEAMLKQFRGAPRFVRIAGASLLPHEEHPALVGEQMLAFASAIY